MKYRTMFPSCLVVLGCGGSSDRDACELAYQKTQQCGSTYRENERARDKFLRQCADARAAEPDKYANAVRCARLSTCDDWRACHAEYDAKAYLEKAKAALAAGRWTEAWDACTVGPDPYRAPSFAATCREVLATAPSQLDAEGAHHALATCKMFREHFTAEASFDAACAALIPRLRSLATAAAIAARDAGRVDERGCGDLDAVARADPDLELEMRRLCSEMNAAQQAVEAIDEAKANRADARAEVPSTCTATLRTLDDLDTAWARARRADVLEACYVGLGPLIIERERKDSRTMCTIRVRDVLQAASRHQLGSRYPALAAAIETLPPACKSEVKP